MITVTVALGVTALTFAGALRGVGLDRDDASWVLFVGAAPMILLRRRYWRCPVCDKDLGRDIDPAACGQCGVVLRVDAQRPAVAGRDPEAVLVEFARRSSRQRWIVFGGLGAVGGVLLLRMVWERLPGPPPTSLWLAFFAAVFGAMMVLARRNWRCPACEQHLGRNGDLRCCPFCAAQFVR